MINSVIAVGVLAPGALSLRMQVKNLNQQGKSLKTPPTKQDLYQILESKDYGEDVVEKLLKLFEGDYYYLQKLQADWQKVKLQEAKLNRWLGRLGGSEDCGTRSSNDEKIATLEEQNEVEERLGALRGLRAKQVKKTYEYGRRKEQIADLQEKNRKLESTERAMEEIIRDDLLLINGALLRGNILRDSMIIRISQKVTELRSEMREKITKSDDYALERETRNDKEHQKQLDNHKERNKHLSTRQLIAWRQDFTTNVLLAIKDLEFFA